MNSKVIRCPPPPLTSPNKEKFKGNIQGRETARQNEINRHLGIWDYSSQPGITDEVRAVTLRAKNWDHPNYEAMNFASWVATY